MSTGITIVHGYTEWLGEVDKETARIIVLWAIHLYGPKKLGVSRTYAYQLRTGKRTPSQELLLKALETMTAKDLLELARLLAEYHGPQGAWWARRLAWLGRRPHTAEGFIGLLVVVLCGCFWPRWFRVRFVKVKWL